MASRAELLKTARSGNADAQFELGCAYDFDHPKKKRAAIFWYHKAAEQGHAKAQNFLGESYRNGDNVKQSLTEAIKWFRLAAAQGEPDAQLSLGALLFYGEGITQDRAEALALYRKAARQRVNDRVRASAELNIGHMHKCGDVVKRSWNRAIRWYLKAAARGNVAAMHWLGRIYNGQAEYPEDGEKAVHWLTRAAECGDAQSQCSLGVRYFNGKGVPADQVVAANWYRRAAEGGDEWAYYLLGLCYRDGTGVRCNRRLAKHWFAKASASGVKEAEQALRALGQ